MLLVPNSLIGFIMECLCKKIVEVIKKVYIEIVPEGILLYWFKRGVFRY